MVLRKGMRIRRACSWCCAGARGCRCCRQVRTADGALAWMRGTGAAAVDQAAADAYVARQTRFDPDVWVLEFDAGLRRRLRRSWYDGR